MDLKSFKLVHEDNDSYHIKHPKGRGMIVSKKGLSEKAHLAIKGMQKFDEGGTVAPEEFVPGQSYANTPLPGDPVSSLAPAPDPFQYAGALEAAQKLPPGQGENGAPIPEVAAPEVPVGGPAPASAPVEAQAEPNPLSQNYDAQNSLLSKEQKEVEAEMKGLEGEGKAKSQAYSDFIDQLPELDAPIQSPQEIAQAYKSKDDALLKAYQTAQIDPDRYLHSKSTGSKVLAGIGLLLGGLGAHATGGRNLALDQLNNAINRDIDAQKNDQAKASNLWKMNREAMHSDLEANLATQNQLWTGVQAKVMKATALAASPEAKLRGQLLIDQLEQQKIHNNLIRGMIGQSTGSAGGGFSHVDPASLVSTFVPEPHQKAVFDEIGKAQNAAKSRQEMLQQFDEAAKQNTVLRTGAGLVRTPAPILRLQNLGLPLIRDQDGRVNEFEQKAFNSLLPAPGDTEDKVSQKRQGLLDFVSQKGAAPTAKGFNLDLSRFASTSQDPRSSFTPQQTGFYNWAIKNAKSPDPTTRDKAFLTLQKLGIQ